MSGFGNRKVDASYVDEAMPLRLAIIEGFPPSNS